MQSTNATFLPLIEALGTRNQQTFLSEVIAPTWDVNSDVLSNLRLVGSDFTGAVIAAGASSNVSVTVAQDTYVTGIWAIEPRAAQDACIVTACFLQRNTGGGFAQVTPLHVRENGIIGGAASWARQWPLLGWPWGALARAGDIISLELLNSGAGATTTGVTIAYRGFQGPPQ